MFGIQPNYHVLNFPIQNLYFLFCGNLVDSSPANTGLKNINVTQQAYLSM